MILYCRKCGNIWQYTGEAEKETSCSNCKAWINLQTQRVDEPLGPTGDYSDAKYLGVSEENSILYYDETHELVIEYFGEPDPYTSCIVTTVPEEELQNYLKNYHLEHRPQIYPKVYIRAQKNLRRSTK